MVPAMNETTAAVTNILVALCLFGSNTNLSNHQLKYLEPTALLFMVVTVRANVNII